MRDIRIIVTDAGLAVAEGRFAQGWRSPGARLDRVRAAGAEDAARRRVRRARDFALEDLTLRAGGRIERGDRGEKGTRIGVLRAGIEARGRRDLHDAPEIKRTITVSQIYSTTARSCEMNSMVRPRRTCRSRNRLMICGDGGHRRYRLAAGVERHGAARREGAALRQEGEGGDIAGDGATAAFQRP